MTQPSEPCSCPAPGYCQRMKRNMPHALWQRCQSDYAFRQTLDNLAPEADKKPINNVGRCRHLGKRTGKMVETTCKSCGDVPRRILLKVYECHHPLHELDPFTTLPDCRRCKDFCH